jgi:1-acyl-sn-glycerol-3-phosphate acyltransferase
MLDKVLYWSGRTVVDTYAALRLDMDVVWHAPLPKGPKIIAANHPTTTDPFLMLTLIPGPMNILITEMCFKVPVFGPYLRASGHIPVVQGNGRPAFDQARQLLGAGRTIGIFPEGALSPLNGGFCKPHTGVARLALSTNTPVIPVGIHLQQERIRFVETEVDGQTEMARWYWRGPYAVTVGEPMQFQGDVEDWAYVRSVSQRIMERISQLSHQSAARMRAFQTFESRSMARPVQITGQA